MKLLAGLGNPGDQYRNTRHNIGFRFLDLLARTQGLNFTATHRFHGETATWESAAGKVLLLKPLNYMNNSGRAVAAAARYYRVDTNDIFIIHDDLDLPSGKLRIRHGGGHAGHKGLISINHHLGQSDYVRIKIGIGRPMHGEVTPWVLGRTDSRDSALENAVFECLLPEVETIMNGQAPTAANHIHLCIRKKTAALESQGGT